MLFKIYIFLILTILVFPSVGLSEQPLNTHNPKHFRKIMIVIFENMSYKEIRNEPTFNKLLSYTGYTVNEKGALIKLLNAAPHQDPNNNGYAFFSNYYNNHSGGRKPTRTSQPNYIALTSGSVHGIYDNGIHDLDVDNLAMELNDANITWKVYAEDLPDPKAPISSDYTETDPIDYLLKMKPFMVDAKKDEATNDKNEQKYIEEFKRIHHINIKIPPYHPKSGCFMGESYAEGDKNLDDGYMRKHEPFISYLNIQRNYNNCKNILNASHLIEDINQLSDVVLYIPNQVNDGHNGRLHERVANANAFLSKMMGTDPKTGEFLLDGSNALFQKFIAQDGLLVITFDEPSVTGNPDKTMYTLFIGNMVNSGAYPTMSNTHLPICYPPVNKQNKYANDKNGFYNPTHCNHYNLLKMIEDNWELRGLDTMHVSAGYKYAFPLDDSIPELWKNRKYGPSRSV